jgi:23S rRNA pseudouridine1911/1915/1917 synthase
MDMVKSYLKEKYNKPGNVYLGLVHRLDRPVRGIVLFAKTTKGASRLSEQFREHETHKMYHAWVEGNMAKPRDILKNYLIKDENRRKAFIYDNEAPGSQYAELEYTVLQKTMIEGVSPARPISFISVHLKTGRFHQIRSQLSHIGHPILGDVKYGSHISFPDGHIELVASSLTFKTATSATIPGGEEKTLTLPEPPVPFISVTK